LAVVSMFLIFLFHVSLYVLTCPLISALTFTVLMRGGVLCCTSITQLNEYHTVGSFLSN
jgi:hypothetical protein